jgi:hypothetical protein
MTLPLIYNRDGSVGENGWVHIVPRGELPNPEAGIVQVLDEIGLNSIISLFNEEKRRLGDRFPGLYFGVEHHIYDPSQSSEALGWSKELALRDNGVWALLEPTDIGSVAIKNRRFKFTSFVADTKDVVTLGGNRVRVMRIESVGFTNLPNGKDLLVPITNRASDSLKSPRDAQVKSAELIARLAQEEQRSSGCSLCQSWLLVMNREPRLAASASEQTMPGRLPAREWEAQAAPAEFAGRMLHQLARARPFPGFFQNLAFIRNRFPGLARMENREAGWDALADLEPAAHAEYLKAKTNPNVFSTQMYAATAALRSQIQNLRPEEQNRKIEELYPQLLSRYRLEGAASEPHFEAVMQSVAIEFPDLGFEGRWEKMKELYPKLFWQFVLSVGSQSEKEP